MKEKVVLGVTVGDWRQSIGARAGLYFKHKLGAVVHPEIHPDSRYSGIL